MIKLTINGQPQSCDVANIDALLLHLQLAHRQVAIELNGTIVPRDTFGDTVLQDGDRLEIVRFVGGG
jgi:thiamine biosynthesis protein ThiS